MPYGRGKEQSICLLASPSVLQAASKNEIEWRVDSAPSRLRMHLEGLPRMVPGARVASFSLFFASFYLAYAIEGNLATSRSAGPSHAFGVSPS